MVGRDEVGGDAGSFLVLHCDQQVCIVPARVAVRSPKGHHRHFKMAGAGGALPGR